MAAPETAAERLLGIVPDAVVEVLDHLHASGHAGYVVGGSLRDALLGRDPADWDLATDALPDQLVKLFHGAVYENRFGTVAIRREADVFEATTFRTEHDYADFRRPHRVEFGTDVIADLARRDFTVNAIAWGREATDDGSNRLVDPFGGVEDLGRRLLRAVGDPGARFREDALRMIRAVRLAANLEFGIEPETLAAIRANAGLVAHLSGERIGAELEKLLAAPRPSIGLRLAEETGLLAVIAPDLAAQVGIPQNKVPGDDLWAHTLLTVDAAPANRPVVRLAALVHDIGKPATLSDGHFHHHDVVGARLAEAWLRRLRFPRAAADDVAHLVRYHMFWADPTLSDAAVRRFLKRVGARHLDNLFALRRADDIGSGMSPDDAAQVAFRARLNAELAAEAALDRYALVIDGDDLMRELGLEPGPRLGRMLDALVDRVVDDPALNERATLLLLAQGMLADVDEAPRDR
jgi:tRNA nucleotidyltransferase (CCA-adding enzyme)